MTMQACRFIVAGKVQGVYFRASTREQAKRLGLRGYAKNLDDGSVEVLAAGDVDALEALAIWLSQGPLMGSVTAVQRSPLEAQAASDAQAFDDFVIA